MVTVGSAQPDSLIYRTTRPPARQLPESPILFIHANAQPLNFVTITQWFNQSFFSPRSLRYRRSPKAPQPQRRWRRYTVFPPARPSLSPQRPSRGLSEGRIQNGGANLAFVTDPFPNAPAPGSGSNTSSLNNASAPVLRIQYLAGSFQDNNVGGAQFYAMWNASGGAFQSMLLSYEVAFDSGFDWVKGGKLPGLGRA